MRIIEKLLPLPWQMQIPSPSNKYPEDETATKRADIEEQRVGKCQKKGEAQPVCQRLGELLQNGRYERFAEKHRLLVPETSSNVHLETMETRSDEMEDVDKAWPEQV